MSLCYVFEWKTVGPLRRCGGDLFNGGMVGGYLSRVYVCGGYMQIKWASPLDSPYNSILHLSLLDPTSNFGFRGFNQYVPRSASP